MVVLLRQKRHTPLVSYVCSTLLNEGNTVSAEHGMLSRSSHHKLAGYRAATPEACCSGSHGRWTTASAALFLNSEMGGSLTNDPNFADISTHVLAVIDCEATC